MTLPEPTEIREALHLRERANKRMMASGDTRKEAVLCGWCGKGASASDDVLLALDAPISKSTGICPACDAKLTEDLR